MREELVKSALRYTNLASKFKADRPIEAITAFKPFTVRELDYQVWDLTQAKQDSIMAQYEDLGLL
jgi:hypothetical protein